MDKKDLYGRIVLAPSKCDTCHLENDKELDCKKVEITGMGTVCLAKNPSEWHDIKKEKPTQFGRYYVHQRWPNNHPFVFVAQYSPDLDEWRPWQDIDVVGFPLDETQREMITHWMPVGVPVDEQENN